MAEVQPIRDKQKINLMKKILKAQSPRDYALFTLGINSGLRISDILRLQFKDVISDEGILKNEIRIKEKKTKKYKSFPLGNTTKKALKEYIDFLSLKDREQDEPLFFSKKKKDGAKQPISRQRAHQIIKDCALEADIKENISTHTLRKTFGYHSYKKGTDLSLLMDIFNHSSQAITLRYIGITKEEKDNVHLQSEL